MPATVPTEATELREQFLEAFDVPESWEEDDTEDFPVREEITDCFPDDYNHQYQLAGYETPSGEYVGIWWLRDGERLQAFYDRDGDSWYGAVTTTEALADEIADEFDL